MTTKINTKIAPQLAEQLPADLIYTIMQYACYKTHPTAKMIKQLIEEDKHHIKGVKRVRWREKILGGQYYGQRATEYIEREAMMLREVEQYDLSPANWFLNLTEQYADISEEWRENLIAYRLMIIEAEDEDEEERWEEWASRYGDVDYRIAGSRAYGLYKIISNCPTMVH